MRIFENAATALPPEGCTQLVNRLAAQNALAQNVEIFISRTQEAFVPYETIAEAITRREYSAVQQAFDFFNEELFPSVSCPICWSPSSGMRTPGLFCC